MTTTFRLGAEWFGEQREYAIDENDVVYLRVGDEKTWRIDRAETERRAAMDAKATSVKAGEDSGNG